MWSSHFSYTWGHLYRQICMQIIINLHFCQISNQKLSWSNSLIDVFLTALSCTIRVWLVAESLSPKCDKKDIFFSGSNLMYQFSKLWVKCDECEIWDTEHNIFFKSDDFAFYLSIISSFVIESLVRIKGQRFFEASNKTKYFSFYFIYIF